MPSSLTWVDHDSAARERSLRILSLFQERESRDELGIGAIRDSISDQLFPGTSTIQTRLRYMLFIPWIYSILEHRKTASSRIAADARRMEHELADAILRAEDSAGVFGKTAGRQLKRLASSVYWSGLGSWGLRLIDASQEEYHLLVDRIYRWRGAGVHRHEEAGSGEPGWDSTGMLVTWHLKLPPPPPGFPLEADLRLSAEEAEFLRECIRRRHPGSLLAHLAWHGLPVAGGYPWEHPAYGAFPPPLRSLVDHAKRFSHLMYGAAILYNHALARLKGLQERLDELVEKFRKWDGGKSESGIGPWDLGAFWGAVEGHGYAISVRTRRFVESWRALVLEGGNLIENPRAIQLVRGREMELKGTRSRFENPRMLDQWQGAAGLYVLSYRWPTVTAFLRDLDQGLRGYRV